MQMHRWLGLPRDGPAWLSSTLAPPRPFLSGVTDWRRRSATTDAGTEDVEVGEETEAEDAAEVVTASDERRWDAATKSPNILVTGCTRGGVEALQELHR